jgi:hypothetical protein
MWCEEEEGEGERCRAEALAVFVLPSAVIICGVRKRRVRGKDVQSRL